MPLLKDEMTVFEKRLREEFSGDGFIETTARDLIGRGGKRLRPAMTIAAAHLGHYDREKVLPNAMALELIHSATLVHDDVIDHAETRRGKTSVHTRHGNHIAIYTGDFLLARGLRQIAMSSLDIQDMARIAAAVEQICIGEVAQYLGRNQIPSYHAYLRRILSKTGILFAAACTLGGYAAGLPANQVQILRRFGMRYGAAFQIKDDLIDIDSNRQIAGKPTGRDLLEGVITLPVLLAAADRDYRAMLHRFLDGKEDASQARELIRLSHELGALRQSKNILSQQIQRCHELLANLPDQSGRKMLAAIVDDLG